MRKVFTYLFMIIAIIAVVILWQIFGSAVNNPSKKFLYIPTNSTYAQVKDSLQRNGLLEDFFWFDQISEYADYQSKVKPGKYKINDNMSVYNLVKMLRSGKQVPVNLVINKLRTKEDLAKRIDRYFEVDSVAAINFFNDSEAMAKFNVDTNNVLTAVIPNTYTYTWATPIEDIFQKLYKEKQKFWNEGRLAKADSLNLTPKEVYILASIVEEETNEPDDKGKIASVYFNRMHKGMKLAADPTVKYAMRDFGLKRIYHKHLQYNSPFNTYQYAGLPPGPICTPAIKTIDAVLDSPETDYLFFVARDDFSGYSDFAATYKQHLIYAKAYQQALDSLMKAKQQKESSK